MNIFLSRPRILPNIKVETDCEKLYSALRSHYGKYAALNGCGDCFSIKVIKTGESFVISFSDKNCKTDDPLQEIENILFDISIPAPDAFTLHAGAVSANGKAYIFTAPTTSGKTTLTAYLALRGFNYITDDNVLIDTKTFKVTAYHKPVHLREGGYEVLDKLGLDLSNVEYLDDVSIKRYIFTPPKLSDDNLDIGAIFFIERNETANEVHNLKPFDAMQLLMQSPTAHRKVDGNYLSFLSLLSKYPCKKLLYKDMNFVRDLIGGMRQ